MQYSTPSRMGVLVAAVCLCVQGQTKDAPPEAKGLPPRTAPSDYQARAEVGTMTLAAEFKGHSIPTLEGVLTTEEYVVVETGLFGSPDARIQISAADFSLRINGKKMPLPSQPYGTVVGSVKDPEWEPEVPAEPKSKTKFGGGGKSEGEGNQPPVPVKVPIAVQRAMALRVRKAALPEGERALPQAGLIFFQYRGKEQGIHSIELIYASPAGKATLMLQH